MFPPLSPPSLVAAPVQTGTAIVIHAPRERIFAAVCDVEAWPTHLPHYRFVHRLGTREGRAILHMSARRGSIPVTWTSEYESDAESLELRFVHIAGWTKGMSVLWTLTPTRSGTRVEIAHHLRFRVPGLGWLAEPIIAGFIHAIASRTLAEFKRVIEGADR